MNDKTTQQLFCLCYRFYFYFYFLFLFLFFYFISLPQNIFRCIFTTFAPSSSLFSLSICSFLSFLSSFLLPPFSSSTSSARCLSYHQSTNSFGICSHSHLICDQRNCDTPFFLILQLLLLLL